ncbi:MAG: outer membrane homotrimeric porin [Desulfomicrobium sp.]|nr:outer membrane homotrimeric porin [Desulfomicrobium sp.]
MKRFALVALLAAMLFGVASSASATELKVKGNLDVYGMWSANLRDFDSDKGDADNYYTTQRMRVYFDFVASENLKAVLGLEMNTDWGQGADGDWGTDGTNIMRVKHAYMDFNFPDTKINVKAGLQSIKLPGIFGNPVFDDDAAALVVSAPINDMFGLTVGYTRGADYKDNYDTGSYSSDNVDMAFLLAPVKLDGFAITPYFGYAWIGDNVNATGQQALTGATASKLLASDDATVWVLGANAKLTMFDPLTIAADLIYGEGDSNDYETKGWYSALAASYKMDMMVATLFGTYATGADKGTDDDYLPGLAQTWMLTPYIGGARAFSTGASNAGFATGTLGEGIDGTGIWTVGLKLDKISFVDKLSHALTIAYAEGTSDKDAGRNFDEKDSAWEVYFVNQYMIYENLAAINELGYFAPNLKGVSGEDDSYFATIGFSYKF